MSAGRGYRAAVPSTTLLRTLYVKRQGSYRVGYGNPSLQALCHRRGLVVSEEERSYAAHNATHHGLSCGAHPLARDLRRGSRTTPVRTAHPSHRHLRSSPRWADRGVCGIACGCISLPSPRLLRPLLSSDHRFPALPRNPAGRPVAQTRHTHVQMPPALGLESL
jgi:hypothetical protein